MTEVRKDNLVPLAERIVVEVDKPIEKVGSIILHKTEKPLSGVVISTGPGRTSKSGKLVPLDIKVGDNVVFGHWAGIKLNQDRLVCMRESDIYGVMV